MQTLTIKARNLDSARGFLSGLAGFHAELVESDDGSYLVEIDLGGPDCEIVAVLNALEDYVTSRAEGPAEVAVAGREYKLHPTDFPRPSVASA
jgi:hypothetical protein